MSTLFFSIYLNYENEIHHMYELEIEKDKNIFTEQGIYMYI